MKKIIILALVIIISISSFSKNLEGIGRGNSETMAKQEALADLSNQIQVEIQSNFTTNSSLINGETNKSSSSGVSTISKTNILGVEFDVDKRWFRSEYTATATLEESDLYLYEKKINELRNQISRNYTNASQMEDLNLKKEYLMSSLNDYSEFESYKNIAIILGGKNIASLPYTKTQLKNEIEKIEKDMTKDSLYNGVNVLYIKSSGKFDEASQNYFDNYFYTMLGSISQENNDKVSISDDNDSTVTTLVKVVLNSSHTSIEPPVLYNKNVITPESFVTTLNITVELYNKNKVENILIISTVGRGTDERSEEASYQKAVKNGFEQMKDKLKEALVH